MPGIDGLYSPRYERRLSSTLPDIEVIPNPLYPAAKSAFKYQSIEIVNLVIGFRALPCLNRVLGAEGMAGLQVARH
jgi:hypothetical protein